jgi:hypothetical protein
MSNLLYPPLLSTEIAVTTNICIQATEFWGIVFRNAHATDATVIDLRNGLTDAGDRFLTFSVLAGASDKFIVPSPLRFGACLRVVLTGGTPTCHILWRRF